MLHVAYRSRILNWLLHTGFPEIESLQIANLSTWGTESSLAAFVGCIHSRLGGDVLVEPAHSDDLSRIVFTLTAPFMTAVLLIRFVLFIDSRDVDGETVNDLPKCSHRAFVQMTIFCLSSLLDASLSIGTFPSRALILMLSFHPVLACLRSIGTHLSISRPEVCGT